MADKSNPSDVGARYAQALFDLAIESDALAAVEGDLDSLAVMQRQSAELRSLLTSPAFSTDSKGRALDAIADRARFTKTMHKFLGLLCANRRLAALTEVTAAFKRLSADRRGIVSAEVVTAIAMTKSQSEMLARTLRAALGRDPEIQTRVDPAILGGVKVKVGSRLYDSSLKSKLDSLKLALKRA